MFQSKETCQNPRLGEGGVAIKDDIGTTSEKQMWSIY